MNLTGEMIEEIMHDTLELCGNDIVLTEQLIEVISKSLGYTEESLITELERSKSIFTANNPIQGFIMHKGKYKPMRRITVFAAVKRIIEKYLTKYSPSERAQILEEIAHHRRVAPLQFKAC